MNKNKLVNGQLEQQKIGLHLLIKNIYYVDFALGLEALAQGNKQFWNHAITLHGPTKAGKTTSLLYMAGQKLSKRFDQQLGMDQICWDGGVEVEEFQETGATYASIGHQNASQTIFPNIQIIQDACIIDFPGFYQNRDHVKLVNHYAFKTVIEKIKAIYFVLVISQQDTWNTLRIQDAIKHFKYRLTLQTQKILPKYLSILLTKSNNQQEDKQRLFQRFQELKNSQTQQYDIFRDAIEHNRIFIFRNQQPSELQGIKLREKIRAMPFLSISDKEQILDNNYILERGEQNDSHKFIQYLRLIMEQIFDQLYKYVKVISLGLKLTGYRLCNNEDSFSSVKKQLEKLVQGIEIDFKLDTNQNNASKYLATIAEYSPIVQEQLIKQYLKILDQVLFEASNLMKRKQLLQKTVDFLAKYLKKLLRFQKNGRLEMLRKVDDNLKYISVILSMTIPLLEKIENAQILEQRNSQKSKEFIRMLAEQTFTEDFIEDLRQFSQQHISQHEMLWKICEDQQTIQTLLMVKKSESIEDLAKYFFDDSAINYAKKWPYQQRKIQPYKQLSLQKVLELQKTAQKLNLLMHALFGKNLIIPRNYKQVTFAINEGLESQKRKKSNYILQKLILDQIVQILDRFSLYEQAIAFALAGKDFEKLSVIIHEAINRRQSLGFDFLIKLSQKCLQNAKDDLAIFCFNQLTQRADSHEQCRKVEQIMIISAFNQRKEQRAITMPSKLLSYVPINQFLYNRQIHLIDIIRRVSQKQESYYKLNFKNIIDQFFKQNNKKLFNNQENNPLS